MLEFAYAHEVCTQQGAEDSDDGRDGQVAVSLVVAAVAEVGAVRLQVVG
jgi:hypothetical protein